MILPSPEAGLKEIISTGTFTLVETPTQRLFITAFHVWRKFERIKKERQNAVMATLNELGLLQPTEFEFVDGDERCLDLVVLRAARGDHVDPWGKSFYRVPAWPISRGKVGESVDLVGYTGKDRAIVGDLIVEFGYTHFCFGVSNVSDRGLLLAPVYGARVVVEKNPIHGEKFEIGGISGGPVFCYRDGKAHLVGFVSEGNTSDDCIFVTHASYVRENGTLDHLTIPY